MKMKKIIFDVIFIIISAVILTILDHYGLLDKYVGFALIPILTAYYLGQYSGKRFKTSKVNKTELD